VSVISTATRHGADLQGNGRMLGNLCVTVLDQQSTT